MVTLNDPFEFKQQEVGFSSRADQACYAGYHGQAVIVAPFGTSANVENPDLAANIIGDWNFVDNNATSLILTGIA